MEKVTVTMNKPKLFLVSKSSCPSCEHVKKLWVPKLEKSFELVLIPSDEIDVPYYPYFFVLGNLGEIVPVQTGNYVKELIRNTHSQLAVL